MGGSWYTHGVSSWWPSWKPAQPLLQISSSSASYVSWLGLLSWIFCQTVSALVSQQWCVTSIIFVSWINLGVCPLSEIVHICFSASEWTVPRYQHIGVTLMLCACSIGQMLFGGVAFAIRDWYTLQLVVSIPLFVCSLLSRYVQS